MRFIKPVIIAMSSTLLFGCGNSHLNCDTTDNKQRLNQTVVTTVEQYLNANLDKESANYLLPNIVVESFNQQSIDENAKRCAYTYSATLSAEDKLKLEDIDLKGLNLSLDFRSTEGGSSDTHLVENSIDKNNDLTRLGLATLEFNKQVLSKKAELQKKELLEKIAKKIQFNGLYIGELQYDNGNVDGYLNIIRFYPDGTFQTVPIVVGEFTKKALVEKFAPWFNRKHDDSYFGKIDLLDGNKIEVSMNDAAYRIRFLSSTEQNKVTLKKAYSTDDYKFSDTLEFIPFS